MSRASMASLALNDVPFGAVCTAEVEDAFEDELSRSRWPEKTITLGQIPSLTRRGCASDSRQ